MVVGGRNQQVKGLRPLRCPKGTPLANLAFGLIEEFGVNVERFGDSTGELELLWRLTGSRIDSHQERKDRRPQRMGASSRYGSGGTRGGAPQRLTATTRP